MNKKTRPIKTLARQNLCQLKTDFARRWIDASQPTLNLPESLLKETVSILKT
jgi:hypothetical protein